MARKRIIVIGGGAAGMMAAFSASGQGASLLLLEKNDRLGKKLGITGKGRCNLTNDCTINELVANIPGNGKFLFSALSRLDSRKTQELFTSWGVELKVERGKRVFPSSDRAGDVIDAMKKQLIQKGVEIKYNTQVRQILKNDQKKFLVKTSEAEFEADVVVLAVGGASYPTTGSTGDGYAIAKELGHKIITPKPALIPLESDSPFKKDLQGLSLRNVNVAILDREKVLGQEFGEMLFTHYGFSGPAILSLSRQLLNWNRRDPKTLSIDLKPALTPEQIDIRILRDFDKFKNRAFKNSLNELLPQSMISVFVSMSGVPEDTPVHSVTKIQRQQIGGLLKDFRLPVSGLRPLAEAIVTAGGIDTKEIDPKTMESKLIPGLYFAGELIDIDGYTGGFNLQAAFSTGYIAGLSGAAKIKDVKN